MNRIFRMRTALPALVAGGLVQAAASAALAQDLPIRAQSLAGGPGAGPATVRGGLGAGGAAGR